GSGRCTTLHANARQRRNWRIVRMTIAPARVAATVVTALRTGGESYPEDHRAGEYVAHRTPASRGALILHTCTWTERAVRHAPRSAPASRNVRRCGRTWVAVAT